LKNLRNVFVLILFAIALYSCDSEVTIDDPKSDTIEDVPSKTGDQGNEQVERNG